MSEQDFAQALELYRSNYVQYRVTGRSEYKLAYENAEKWLNSYIESISTQITDGKIFVDSFLHEYANANPDLELLRNRFKEIRTKGSEVQDEYQTVRAINASQPTEVDMSPTYTKIGVAVALVGATLVLTML